MTIVDILQQRASTAGKQVAFSCPERDDAITYDALWRRTQEIAAAIRAHSAPGDRVVLAFTEAFDFIPALFGTFASGRIAVPAPADAVLGSGRIVQRLDGIRQDAEPSLVLNESSLRELLDGRIDAAYAATAAVLDDCAYLQYTSGSTSQPRGVRVLHRNIIANCRFAHRYCGFSADAVLVSWVPHYHDQGLVYGICQPIVDGFPCVLLSARTFIQRPRAWLEAIARFRATHAGGPNFAYEVTVRKVPAAEREGLDLSSWRCAYNAGEPVRATTLEAFADAFAPCGFSPSAFQPCYGLAEATLRVAASPLGQPPRILSVAGSDLARGVVRVAPAGESPAIALVGHGPAACDGRTILVVDEATGQPALEARVGELWVSGPDVADGYWRRDPESTEAFAAFTADGRGPFLRTGDLGFVKDGELFVAGRSKDLVLVNGLNHYPQDIEATVERVLTMVRPGCAAAFGINHEEGERLVVVAEVRDLTNGSASADWDYVRVRAVLERAIADEHGLTLHDFVPIVPATLPKTTSGKVRRQECRRLYLNGELTASRDVAGLERGMQFRLRTISGVVASATPAVKRPPAQDPLAKPRGGHREHRLLAEFVEPKRPHEVAALYGRTPDECAGHLRRIAEYVKSGILIPAGRSPRRTDRCALGVTRWIRPESRTLFFAFTGKAVRLMMPPIAFLTHTRMIERNVVMFRDRAHDRYLSGISAEMPTLDAVVDYQRGVLDAAWHVTHAYAVGTSMGALPAIVSAHALGLEAAWVFGLQEVNYTSQQRPGARLDLREVLAHSNGITRYHVYFHEGYEKDARCARALADLPGVVLHPQPGNSHMVVQSMWRSGQLAAIFPDELGTLPAAPPAPASRARTSGPDVERVLRVVQSVVDADGAMPWSATSGLRERLDSFATIELLAALEGQLVLKIDVQALRPVHLETPATLTAFLSEHARAAEPRVAAVG